MTSYRWLAILTYAVLGLVVGMGVEVNEFTAQWVALAAMAYVAGLALLVASPYLLPKIFRGWRLCEAGCRVDEEKYIICEGLGTPEKAGMAVLKVVPEQPAAYMDRERREAYLNTLTGLLSGTEFEVALVFMAVRDPYAYDVKRELRAEKMRLLSSPLARLAGQQVVQEKVREIDRELSLLERTPAILKGLYIVAVRDYHYDEAQLKARLDAHIASVKSRLGSIGVTVKEVTGEELRVVRAMLCLGRQASHTWL